jgi:tight adherence protein B
MNQQKLIINTLINTNTKIIDKNNVDYSDNDETKFLVKKLKFAGFSSKGADYIFIVICLLFGLLISSFIFFIAKSKIIFIFTFLIFIFLPYLILVKIIKVREEEFNFSLKEIIDKVTSMMKSGVGFEQAFKKSILTSKSELSKKIFNIYIHEKAVIGEDKCFDKMFKLVESRELRIFYLVISIGRKSGGKFSNTLEKLRKTLHDQGEIKQEITSSTKEIKIGTYMIIGLIVFTYIMMDNALNNSLNAHFFGSSTGKIQMFFIILWVAFGLFINSLLTKIK